MLKDRFWLGYQVGTVSVVETDVFDRIVIKSPVGRIIHRAATARGVPDDSFTAIPSLSTGTAFQVEDGGHPAIVEHWFEYVNIVIGRFTGGGVVSYGYLGSITTKPGCRDDVIAILLRGVDGLQIAGCTLYLVAAATSDPNVIWVTEAWLSKRHHDESLQLPEAKAAIAEAMPMLTGAFTSEEVAVIGGLGVR